MKKEDEGVEATPAGSLPCGHFVGERGVVLTGETRLPTRQLLSLNSHGFCLHSRYWCGDCAYLCIAAKPQVERIKRKVKQSEAIQSKATHSDTWQKQT